MAVSVNRTSISIQTNFSGASLAFDQINGLHDSVQVCLNVALRARQLGLKAKHQLQNTVPARAD